MAKGNTWRLRGLAVSAVALLGATVGSAGCDGGDDVAQVECESTRTYFARKVWAPLDQKCYTCHNPQGVASTSKFVLKGSAEAGFIDANLAVIRDIALFERDGKSQFLVKPTMDGVPHEGGLVLDKNSSEYKALLGLVVRLKNDEQCDDNNADTFAGVDLAGPEQTLRKAAIVLVGRLPTEVELARVEEGGFAALDQIIDEMMTEEAFYDFMKRTYGDLFQTDFYLNDGVGQLEDIYANARWFENEVEAKAMVEQYGLRSYDEVGRFTQQSIAREPLELIEHVVKNDLPFSEILTADYMMVSPFSARSYGATDVEFENPNDPFEFQPARLTAGYEESEYGYPHAGVLTSPMFLNRWPTTDTNRNRARARVFLLFFLGTDILKTAEQPVDQTGIADLNPTRNNEQCTICHYTIDPIAGAFMAFDDEGRWNQEPQWHPEMFPPGFAGADMPGSRNANGLQWLAQRAVTDDRFGLGVVYNVYRGLTGREPLIAPTDYADPLYNARFESFLAQANVFRRIADRYHAANDNVKLVVKDLVMSPYFRAVNAVPMPADEVAKVEEVGLGRLLPPEMLHNKIQAVLGVPWGDPNAGNADGYLEPYLSTEPRDLADTGRFQLFYGGVDYREVSARITDPNGLMAAVAERMATEMSCQAVPNDLSQTPEYRELFPVLMIDGVEYDPKDLVPESGGLEVPGAVVGIKQTIANLHYKILGERIAVSHPEVERTYQLFLETWREGIEKMDNEELGSSLPGACQVDEDYWTGNALPEEQRIEQDENYTIRAWMAVMTYLLSDFKFLYE